MAYFHTIYTCALFLAAIACHETPFTEGRQLKSTKRQELSSKEDQRDIGKHGSRTHQTPTVDLQVSIEGDVHGAGNSAAKETLPQQSPNQSRAFGDSDKESVDDFRPTAPGSSPGVGHSFADHNVDIQPEALGNSSGVDQTAAGNTDDFRPTVPGHSPGVGHSLRNKNAKLNA